MRFYVRVKRFSPPISAGYDTTPSTRQHCEQFAQTVCHQSGRSAEIVRQRDSKVVMRYWRDDTGLQYLEY